MVKIIQHKSQIRALKLKLKLKIKYLEIHKFTFKNIIFLTIEYKMCLKILQKLRCLVGFQNRQSAPIGRGKNLVNFEFLKGNLVKKSLPLPTKRKLSILLNFLFPVCLFVVCFERSSRARQAGTMCKKIW